MNLFSTLKFLSRHIALVALVLCAFARESSGQGHSGEKIIFPEPEMKLIDAFFEIERQTEFSFAYNGSSVDTDQIVRTDIAAGISETLDYIFGQAGLKWKIEKFKILVSTEEKSAGNDEYIWSGTVSDSSGEPLAGASVIRTATGTGVTSDADGRFSIACSYGDTLRIMFLGFKDLEVVYTESTPPPIDNAGRAQHAR